MKLAGKLLDDWVSDGIKIEIEDYADAKEAYNFIKMRYSVTNERAHDILQEVGDENELKPKARRGRPRLNRERSNLPKSEQKRKRRLGKREEAIREIEVAGLGDYCTVIEFET